MISHGFVRQSKWADTCHLPCYEQVGLSDDEHLLHAVLRQAYLGLTSDLSPETLSRVREVFSSEEVVRKGLVTDVMFEQTAYRQEALAHLENG